jgi:serine/threonine protein kinase
VRPASQPSPSAIAHYRILDRIGSGGLGELYRARDTQFGRTVAVRVLPSSVVDDSERLNNVLRAARSVAALSHPNIAALFDVGEDGPIRYLAFEFVPGELLSAKLQGQPLDARRTVDFAIQLADALAEAESHEIVHGDIRSDTIVITPKDHAKFLHFGLTPFTTGGAAQAGERSGLSPDDGLGGGQQNAQNDIRALGLVMNEMLTGRRVVPARPETDRARPRAINTAVPSELDAIVRKMLSKDPDKSYKTAATVVAELRAVAAILDTRAEAAETGSDLQRPERSGGRPLIAIIVIAALTCLALWIWRSGVWRHWG